MRSSLRHALTISAALGALAAIANAGLESVPQPLEVCGAPAPGPLPEEWEQAVSFHADDFEHLPDGSYPPRWRYHPGRRTVTANLPAVRRTLDGGGVLHLRDAAWVPLREKPTGGRLRIEFDFRRFGTEPHGLNVHLIDTRPPVDAGWREAEEFGPWIDIDGSSGEVTSRRFDDQRGVHGKADLDQWHRLTIMADLDDNRFSLAIDGRERGASISFYDPRWFRGGDRLVFQSPGALLDKIEPGGTWTFTGGRFDLELAPLQPLVLRVEAMD